MMCRMATSTLPHCSSNPSGRTACCGACETCSTERRHTTALFLLSGRYLGHKSSLSVVSRLMCETADTRGCMGLDMAKLRSSAALPSQEPDERETPAPDKRARVYVVDDELAILDVL